MVDQAIDRGLDARQSGGTGGIGGEVRAAQVVDRRHSTSHDVAELAGHGVLGAIRQAPPDLGAELGQDGLALGRGQPLEARTGAQGVGVLRIGEAQHRLVVPLAAHRVAQDDGGRLRVEGIARAGAVPQRLAGAQERPLLPVVHGCGHARRDLQLRRFEGDAAHPSADLRVGLARSLRIGVPIVRGIPAIVRDLGDRVAAFEDVAPKGRHVRGVGQDRSHANHRDGALRCIS